MNLDERREEEHRFAVAGRQIATLHKVLSETEPELTLRDVAQRVFEVWLSREDPGFLRKMRKEQDDREDQKAGRHKAGGGRY